MSPNTMCMFKSSFVIPVRKRLSPAERTRDNPLGLYRLTSDRIQRKTEAEIDGERLAAENERSSRLRYVYEAIGLTVTAQKDGRLLLR